ncbi:C-type lectin domain family 4 member E-like, partial [Hyalella azteca]|uniref:C-type lectin domain family 4 member E-like n=1 Tax=Hyalella azteca TaxID=294128 RepID=A0A8B7NSV8_HYAAZ
HSDGRVLSYDQAVAYCLQLFGRLPVLHDVAAFTDVATFVNDGYSANTNNGYWLGATNSTATHVWQWSDGSAVQIGPPFWAYNAPSKGVFEPNGGRTEGCAGLYSSEDWAFHDLPCNNVWKPLCSSNPVNGLCAHPFILVGTQCVHVILTEHNWSDARTQCGLVGGDLIILDDYYKFRKLFFYLQQFIKDWNLRILWIGGSDLAVQGQWRWIDGSKMAMGLPYWGTSAVGHLEPDNPGVENCLELSSVWRYRFSNTLCFNTRRVICEAQPF